jgi:hypothetical protein
MFVFPMVGLSNRFIRAGYQGPKYMLPLWGETVFHQVVRSFDRYFNHDKFLFICRDNEEETNFIKKVLHELEIKHYRLSLLESPTLGQAQTVAHGLQEVGVSDSEELYIFNIDTFRPGFTKPIAMDLGDAWLEVFKGDGDHWSFVLPGTSQRVLQTTEKERISDLCSDGLYYFKHKEWFMLAYQNAAHSGQLTRGEYYVAPLYNYLIEQGLDIRYGFVAREKVTFCGIPEEYEYLLSQTWK